VSDPRDGADLPPRPDRFASSAPLDIGLAPGVSIWAAGPWGGGPAAFAMTMLVGYRFGADSPTERLRFRLGAVLQYSAFHEPGATDTFIDVLVDPTLRIRVWEQRFFVSADVGFGILALGGLKPSSVFLEPNQPVMVSGAQSLFEARPGLTASFRLNPALDLFAGPAMAWSPQKKYFHQPIVRVQVLAGAALRF
jgi:hypothetical protein